MKSGRHIVELKVTDYTDSLVLKMFTRIKMIKDLAHFKALSVGKWVRAQGRIEDTFVRDLVMMMSDIEEIKSS